MKKGAKIILAVVLVVLLVLLLLYLFNSCSTSKKAAVKAEAPKAEARSLGPEGQMPWLELPAMGETDATCHVVTHRAEMGGRSQRNYTYLYDEDLYAAYWVAYPLCADHMSSGREEDWSYDPSIDVAVQTSVRSGYGASEPTENYPKNFYARGHQLPNADRSGVPEMMAQTYYSTNMTPQLQNGFNGAIWAKLEEGVRGKVPAGDTLYVVTGAAFEKRGEQPDGYKTITNKNDKKQLPVPEYYWKALLKVTRDGDSIVSASAVGFWLPHADLKGHDYADYVVPVDQIEEWTGFDMFPGLPDDLEAQAESRSSWTSF